jgi:hypothetical protein
MAERVTPRSLAASAWVIKSSIKSPAFNLEESS